MERRAGTPWARAIGVVVLIGIAVSALISGAEAQGSWSEVAPMPSAYDDLVAAVFGKSTGPNSLYVVGQVSGSRDKTETSVYESWRKKWDEAAPMPSERVWYAGGVVSSGRLYVVGGADIHSLKNTKTVDVYDPDTNKWAKAASMSHARSQHAVVGTGNGRLYALGGGNAYDPGPVDTVEVYYESFNSWRAANPMPTAREAHAAGIVESESAYEGKIYVVGGRGTEGQPLDTVEVYDPATETWAAAAPMPTARWGLAAGVVGGKLYAVGGAGTVGGVDNQPLDTVEVYDPDKDSWTALDPLPTARFGLAAGVIDGKLYAVGGTGTLGGVDLQPLDTVEVYDPSQE